MQIIIKSRHTVLPKRIKEMAAEKFEKVGKLLDKIQTLEVAFGEERNPRIADKHHVEVTLVTKNRRLHATASGPDVMSAVDKVISKVEAQVRKVKGKAIGRSHRAPGVGKVAAVAAAVPLTKEELDGEKQPSSGKRSKPAAKKPAGSKKVAAAKKPRKRASS
ncbi:MAG: ribosome hibernation-promoting factor, HPF/YfiA family [Actinomycetota bacterium]